MKIIFREAKQKNLKLIKQLISRYPRQLLQHALPKLSDFFVAAYEGQIIGCCALEIYSKKLAEVRSLAVEKKFQHGGVATRLVKLCLARARRKKIYEVLTITGIPQLFTRLGFRPFKKQKYALFK